MNAPFSPASALPPAHLYAGTPKGTTAAQIVEKAPGIIERWRVEVLALMPVHSLIQNGNRREWVPTAQLADIQSPQHDFEAYHG